MFLLPHEHRAPFIAPGRRNRKVHWNRPLHRAINSLGKFEKEDWRRALWLPESLRQFYPRWNNQFSPGGGSGCGCCGAPPCPPCSTTPDEWEVVFGTINNDSCSDCSTAFSGQTFICPLVAPCVWVFNVGTSGVCGDGIVITQVGVRTVIPNVLGASIGNSATGMNLAWTTTVSDPYDCAAISGMSLSYFSDSGHCDISAATCVITAL